MKSVFVFFLVIILLVEFGIFANSVTFNGAVNEFGSSLTGVTDALSAPFKGVLRFLGVIRSPNSEFTAYFYMRDRSDEGKFGDYEYFDRYICYMVYMPSQNFFVSAFNCYVIKDRDEYIDGLQFYFDSSGKILFVCGVGNPDYNPLGKSPVYSVEEFIGLFDTLYLIPRDCEIRFSSEAVMGHDDEFKLSSDGFARGIYSGGIVR